MYGYTFVCIVQSPALFLSHPLFFWSSPFHIRLDDRLQLSRIAQRVLDDSITCDIFAMAILVLLGEIYPAVLDHPARLLRKLNNAALGVEEKQRFGVWDGDGGVRFLAARGNLLADGANEDLLLSAPILD